MVRESHDLCAAVSGGTTIALARVKTWNPGDTLTAADLNAEFNNILNNPTSLINLSAAGDVCIVSSAAAVTRLAIGTAGQTMIVSTGLLPVWGAPVLQSYLAGCQITAITQTSSGTITHSSGIAVDSSSNAVAMVLSSALIGTTTGAFIAGNNQPKLQVSPLAVSTAYHIYVISSVLGGSVDVLYSSSTSPTLPTGYAKSRRVGSFLTGSTGNILPMTQNNEGYFWLSVPVQDAAAVNPGTAAVTRTLTVPTGVVVSVIHSATVDDTSVSGAGPNYCLITALAQTDTAVTSSGPFTFQCGSTAGSGGQYGGTLILTDTNASGQIRTRLARSSGTLIEYEITHGWIDSRGRTS